MSQLHVGIFGPGLSGKTTLAKFHSRMTFAKRQRKSIVLDPIESDWGPHATVFGTAQEEDFWRMVWESRDHLVFCDEGAETIGRRKDLVPAFTRIRHNGHRMVVIGHRSSSTLLPVMRDQISTLFLARQPEDACKIWARQFSDEAIFQAMHLKQYQFLWCDMWRKPKILEGADYYTPPAKK